jgi:hypothetical protein
MTNIIKKYKIAQASANTDVEFIIPTGIAADSRQGWAIKRVTAWFASAAAVISTADITVNLQLNAETGTQDFLDNDSIAYLIMLFNGVAASTSGFQIDAKVEWVSLDGRVTVQPELYLRLVTSGAGAACGFNVEIEYEVIKLTDVEMLRLLQGGA